MAIEQAKSEKRNWIGYSIDDHAKDGVPEILNRRGCQIGVSDKCTQTRSLTSSGCITLAPFSGIAFYFGAEVEPVSRIGSFPTATVPFVMGCDFPSRSRYWTN